MKQHLQKALCFLLVIPMLLTGCMQEDEVPGSEVTDLIQSDELQQEEALPPSGSILPELFSLPYLPGKTLDPITCLDGMQQTVSSLLYEGLFRLTPELEPEPYLCSRYTYDPATCTYVFTLRDNVLFSDNTPLTAEDIRATLLRAKTSSRYSSRLADVVSITAGENTLTITLTSPNTGFPALLDIPIVKSGTESDTAPIGTGPYQFADADGAALVANQLWWRGLEPPTGRIGLVETSDLDSVRYRLTSHDIQLVTVDLAGTDPIIASGNIVYQDTETTILQYIGFNLARAPMNSMAFRNAMSLGLQRSSLADAFLSGHASPAQFPVSPVSLLYPAHLETDYSGTAFADAVSALEVGFAQPLTLLVNAENSFKVSLAQQLASTYTQQGIPVTVQALPWAEYTAALAAGNFDLYYGEVKLTADWDLTALLTTGGALNYGGWSNPQTETLMAAYASAEDRTAAMENLCTHLQLLNPILPVCFKRTSVLLQNNVLEGLTPTAAEPFYQIENCTIHLDMAESVQ